MLDAIQVASYIQAIQSEPIESGELNQNQLQPLSDLIEHEGLKFYDAVLQLYGGEFSDGYERACSLVGSDLVNILGHAEGEGATPAQVAIIFAATAIETMPEGWPR